jgi:two-component system chemotaxis response regulator CheY
MKALVVDRSPTMRSVLRRILSMRGLEVAEAGDGAEALHVLRGMGKADLVLVDWNLAEGSGLEFTARLRQELPYDTKVILLAATEPGPRELQRAVIAGADAYLMKPFTSLQMDEELNQAGFVWRD